MPIINIAIEGVGLAITLILLFSSLTDSYKNKKPYQIFITMLVFNCLLLISDMAAWGLYNSSGHNTFLYIDVSLNYCFGYMISCLLSHYIISSMRKKEAYFKPFLYIMVIFCILAMCLVVLSFFNKMYFYYTNGVYTRGKYFWLSQTIPILILLANEIIVLKNIKKLGLRYALSLLSYGILPIAAMILQIFITEIEITYLASTVSLLIIHVVINTEQSRLLHKKEAELTEAKIDIMLSQIQPHFLYNSLGSIRELCNRNPKKAEDAIVDFSDYLRWNIDSLKTSQSVDFEKELSHIEKYLKLEKMRFGDKLNVCYDIKAKDFMLPPLTIQPLVENAVKYGVFRKKDGGTVTIATYETENDYIITVSDDGVGFKADKIPYDADTHLGIDNVKKRLLMQRGATLEISSKKDVGTVARINLPKEWTKDEHTYR